MGRSSRLLVLACLLGATPAFGQARGGAVMRPQPSFAPRFAARPTLPVMRPGGAPVRAGPGLAGRGLAGLQRPVRSGAIRRRHGFGSYGGPGLALAGDLAAPPTFEGGYGPEPLADLAPPPCVRPQIIKIGPGIRHSAPTRVVYGQAVGCVP